MRWILWVILGIVVLVVIFLVYSDAQAKKFAEAERIRKQTTSPVVGNGVPATNWIDSLTVLIHGGTGIIESIKEKRERKRREREAEEQVRWAQQLTPEEAQALL